MSSIKKWKGWTFSPWLSYRAFISSNKTLIMTLKNFKDGILLTVKVKPNSPRFSIKRNDQIIIHCKSPPEKNKANIEIIKKLQRIFNREVEIMYGSRSNKKAILIHNINEKEVISKL